MRGITVSAGVRGYGGENRHGSITFCIVISYTINFLFIQLDIYYRVTINILSAAT